MAQIQSARVVPIDEGHHQSRLYVTVDGTEHLLFTFFDDRASFDPKELEGLTEHEVRELWLERDPEYAQLLVSDEF